MSCATLLHDPHTPQLSSTVGCFPVCVSPNNETLPELRCFGFTFSQSTYCANAMARGKAPLPSLPKNNSACERRLLWTSSVKCFLVASWPIKVLNCMNVKGKIYLEDKNDERMNSTRIHGTIHTINLPDLLFTQ